MKKLFLMAVILGISLILYNCDYDPVDDKKPSLIASMNNPNDNPDDKAFQNYARLDKQTPTFVWTHIKKASQYNLIVYNMEEDKEYIFQAKVASDLENVAIGDLLTFTIPNDRALALSKEKNGDLIPYRWIVVAKDGVRESYSDDRYFYIVGEIDLTTCDVPSGYISVPAKCNTSGDILLSWNKGSDNLHYFIDIKVDGVYDEWQDKIIDVGAYSEIKFNQDYFDKLGKILDIDTGLYGTFHYRVRYLNPYNSDCEGLLPEGQFSYVIKPRNLKTSVYGYDASKNEFIYR